MRRSLMPFWKKLWLLFTVMWVVVALLQIVTILAFGEEIPPEKALTPAFFAVAVPAALYFVGWFWQLWKTRRRKP